MSRDLVLGRTRRDFAIGSLPEGAEDYAPTKWIKETEAETLVAKLMDPPGFFARKLTREQAERKLLAELRAKKIGIMSAVTGPGRLAKKY